MARLKDIPQLDREGRNLQAVADSMREALQTFRGYRGDPLDKALTLRDLKSGALAGYGGGGVVILPGGGGGSGGGGGTYVPDLTPPPTPTGLNVTPGISHFYVEHDTPTYTQGHGHASTRVYGAKWAVDDLTPPTFSEAVVLFNFEGTFDAYPSDPATRWCIWIKWKSVDGILSTAPAGGTNGFQVTTGQDVALLLAALYGKITRSQLFIDLGTPIDSIQAGQDSAALGILNSALQAHDEQQKRAADLTREAYDRGTALTDVRRVVREGDEQLAQQIVTLTAATASTSAALRLESTTRASEAAAEALLRATLAAEVRDPATGLAVTRATLINDYSTITSRDVAIASSAATLTAAYGAADVAAAAGAVTAANAYTLAYGYAKATIDGAFAAQFNSITANYQGADTAALAVAAADVRSYSYAKSTVDGAIASAGTTLTTAYGLADGAVQAAAAADVRSYSYSKSAVDGAIATSSSTLTASYGSAITAAVLAESLVRSTVDGGLLGQATLKIDLNGYIAGWGLASTVIGGTPSSSFIIRAGDFSVASPTGPGIAPIVPFTVITVPTTINGVPVPVGIFADGAFILNGTIGNAQIGNAVIDDAKIATVSASKIRTGTLVAGASVSSSNFASGSAGFLLRSLDGYIEGNNVVLRGTIYASAGSFTGTVTASAGYIGGWVIGLHDFRSSNYVPGTAGARLNDDGSTEIYNLTARGNITANSLNAATGTLGALTIDATGNIRSVQTGYNTGGTGSWRGFDGGVYKESVGNPTGPRMLWDGTDLFINSPSFDTFSATITGGDLSVSAGTPQPTIYGSRTVAVSGGKTPYSYIWLLSNGGQTSVGSATGASTTWITGGSTAATVTIAGNNAITANVLNQARVICMVSDANKRLTVASFLVQASHPLNSSGGSGGTGDGGSSP